MYPIVRPEKFGEYAKKNIRIYQIFWNFISFFLLLLLIPYNLFLFLFSLAKWITCKNVMKNTSKVFLSFNYLLEKRISYTDISYKNYHWLVRPFSKSKVPGLLLTVYELLNLKILLWTLVNSIFVVPLIIQKYGFRNIIYALNSFEWYIVCAAINNFKNVDKIYFANQKDRWAILFDNSDVKSKILLQHGIEIVDGYFETVKLKSINTGISFNQREADALRKVCLDCDPQFVFYKHSIQLVNLYDNKKTVLIIGNSFEFFKKEEFIIRLLQSYDFKILLKPHPLLNKSCYYKLVDELQFEVVDDNIFPKADLVISYHSTLAIEYEMLGITVIYHEDFSLKKMLPYLI
jgi:hypothetical protein